MKFNEKHNLRWGPDGTGLEVRIPTEEEVLDWLPWGVTLAALSVVAVLLACRSRAKRKGRAPESERLEVAVGVVSPSLINEAGKGEEEATIPEERGSGDGLMLNVPPPIRKTNMLIQTYSLDISAAGDKQQEKETTRLAEDISAIEERVNNNESAIEKVLNEISSTKANLQNVQKELAEYKKKIDNDVNKVNASVVEEVKKTVDLEIKQINTSQNAVNYNNIKGTEEAIVNDLRRLEETLRELKKQTDSITINGDMPNSTSLRQQSSFVDLRPLSQPFYVTSIKARTPLLLSSKRLKAPQPTQNVQN